MAAGRRRVPSAGRGRPGPTISLHVLDTDTLSLYQRGHSDLMAKIDALHARDPGGLAITVVTVEEAVGGWYGLLRKARTHDQTVRAYARLGESVSLLARWQILPIPLEGLLRYEVLLRMNLNVRKMDLRIAAIVLEKGATLVSRNLRDFRRVPGLRVEDWSA